MFELDHLFVCVNVDAPEAELLVDFGLTEGEPNVHPGQGTACRRFFFHNAMLELLWVHDPVKAQSELVRPTQLWQRWSQRNAEASPFGVCLRPARSASGDVPFPSWEYRPPYLPKLQAFHIGENTPLLEPLWCYLSQGRRQDTALPPQRQPLEHPVGLEEVTLLRLTTPSADSAAKVARVVSQTGVVTLQCAPEHLSEITFDGGTRGLVKDFRPALPLIFRW